MKTDLNLLFSKMSNVVDGQYEPFPDGFTTGYEEYLANLRSSRTFRLHSRLKKPEELWTVSKIGVILCDALTMSGYAPSKSGKFRIVCENINSICRNFDPAVLHALGRKFLSFVYFDDESVLAWLDDAAPFIEDGRLLYMPQRTDLEFHGRLQNGRPDWRFESTNDNELQPTIDSIRDAKSEGASTLVLDEQLKMFSTDCLKALEVAMPFLENIPLKTLHTVLNDEEDTLINFRKTLSSIIPTYLAEITDVNDPNKIISTGINIRRDLLEPEISALNRAFKKIIQVKAIKVLGASVSTIGLGVAALSTGGLIAGVLSAGGFGAIANEYSGYRKEFLSLKDNPYYFAWHLNKKA